MATKDKRIDAYITKAQPFAQPVMKKLRKLVHKACPDVTETIKWGMPSFEYKGPMFGFAAFKQHCVAGFWKHKLLNDPNNYLGERKNQGGEAMGNFGCMKSIKDLPPEKAIIDFIKQHMKLNDEGIKVARKPVAKKEMVVSKELIAALSKNKKQKQFLKNFLHQENASMQNGLQKQKPKQKKIKD